jgi:hypothetical protein
MRERSSLSIGPRQTLCPDAAAIAHIPDRIHQASLAEHIGGSQFFDSVARFDVAPGGLENAQVLARGVGWPAIGPSLGHPRPTIAKGGRGRKFRFGRTRARRRLGGRTARIGRQGRRSGGLLASISAFIRANVVYPGMRT